MLTVLILGCLGNATAPKLLTFGLMTLITLIQDYGSNYLALLQGVLIVFMFIMGTLLQFQQPMGPMSLAILKILKVAIYQLGHLMEAPGLSYLFKGKTLLNQQALQQEKVVQVYSLLILE